MPAAMAVSRSARRQRGFRRGEGLAGPVVSVALMVGGMMVGSFARLSLYSNITV